MLTSHPVYRPFCMDIAGLDSLFSRRVKTCHLSWIELDFASILTRCFGRIQSGNFATIFARKNSSRRIHCREYSRAVSIGDSTSPTDSLICSWSFQQLVLYDELGFLVCCMARCVRWSRLLLDTLINVHAVVHMCVCYMMWREISLTSTSFHPLWECWLL